jgi:signal peptidase I
LGLAQEFEHPIMSTNDAIKTNKIIYGESGIMDLDKYIIDLDKNKVTRITPKGEIREFDIIKKEKDQTIFNILVKYRGKPDVQYVDVNLIYQKENDNKNTLICRWIKDGKVYGWFNPEL